MVEFFVKRIELDRVMEKDRELFNVNNLWSKEGTDRPEDYDDCLRKTNTCNWIDLFHQGNYATITLDKKDLFWMSKAMDIGLHTRKCSALYRDELDETEKRYRSRFEEICQQYGRDRWFVRTERVSLKYGQHGVGPYLGIREIVESAVSSNRGHEAFKSEEDSCRFYLIPWLEMSGDKEFRIFVYQNKITAISQQNLYSVNEWLADKKDSEIIEIAKNLVDGFERDIAPKMFWLESYVMDLVLLGEELQPYFIEPNTWGGQYSSGSSLFHWEIDQSVLYGDGKRIEIRFVDR